METSAVMNSLQATDTTVAEFDYAPESIQEQDLQRCPPEYLQQLKRLLCMQAYAERCGATELAYWVSRAPKDAGSRHRGKLSADQWRTLCTIHLPITLVKEWATATNAPTVAALPSQDRQMQMLTNFMDLVTAVNIAGSLVTSEANIRQYEESILRYLRNLKHLYPEASIKPNHHIAIHLVAFLRLVECILIGIA